MATKKKANRSAKKKSGGSRARAKKKTARRAAKPAARNSSRRKPAAKKVSPAPKPSTGVLGEGDWKSGERYNESLQSWGAAHDATALAHEAEGDLPEDLRESNDSDVADASARGAEKKSEPDEEW